MELIVALIAQCDFTCKMYPEDGSLNTWTGFVAYYITVYQHIIIINTR